MNNEDNKNINNGSCPNTIHIGTLTGIPIGIHIGEIRKKKRI